MNSFINTLSDTVLSKKLELCGLEELQTLSQTYPYSSAIQLLYAQKLKTSDNPVYHQQLQKTLLYYSNPLFIKHLIEAEEPTPSLESEASVLPAGAVNTAKPEEVQTKTAIAVTIPEPLTIGEPSESVSPEALMTSGSVKALQEEQPQANPVNLDDRINEEEEDSLTEDPGQEAALPPLPEFKFTPLDPAKAELAFTPYHTIDYFAAQGIKLGDDQQGADRFGTQLKSFTAWLKQMKRLPGATAKGNISITEEKSIEQMAAQSLQGENADTEAMAQVWAKQGNAKKAIDIYKKLSLQIPAKSAYFAAKIDHLKK